MYLIARFPNVVDDFDEPVYLQSSRIGIDPNDAGGKVLKSASMKAGELQTKLAAQVNTHSFPGAVLPISVLDKDVADDHNNAKTISTTADISAYGDKDDFKTRYNIVSYKFHQDAMVVDHWVHYDGCMVVELGEIKTRW